MRRCVDVFVGWFDLVKWLRKIKLGEWLLPHSIVYYHTLFIAFVLIFLKYPQLKVIFNFYLLPLLYLKSYLLIILINIKYKIRQIKNVKDKS